MAVMVVVLSACVGIGQPPLSPEELRAIDRDKCSSFGFKPRSKDFADCMMKLSLEREANEAADRRARQIANAHRAAADQAERHARAIAEAHQADARAIAEAHREAGRLSDKELSFLRSGDTRFPVCTATSEDSHLNVSSGTWYGKACRAR
jgi:hypothetical protein